LVLRQKQHADRQRLPGAQGDARLAQKIAAGNGGLYADAVAALTIGRDGTAMREATESGQSQAKNLVLGPAVQSRDKSDATGIVLEAGA